MTTVKKKKIRARYFSHKKCVRNGLIKLRNSRRAYFLLFFFHDYNIFLPPILFRGDGDRKYDLCPWLTFRNNHKKIESKPI